MMEIVDTNQIQGFLDKTSSRPSGSAGALPGDSADVSVQVDYASLIDRAMQAAQTDTKAVQQAKELLLSGKLESNQRVLQASENIINLGI